MTNNLKNNTRFYELDIIRFIAAISVVFFHYTFRGYIEGGYIPVEFINLKNITKYGYLGVDIFFIISGFVILMTAYNRTTTSFVISRITRLYPAFWISVTITALTIAIFGHPMISVEISQYLYNLTMVSGFFGVEHVDGVYWSLLVELKFYLLIFILIMLNQIRFIKYHLGLWLAALLISKFYSIPGVVYFFIFPEWAPYFIAGATFYLIHHEGLNLYKILLITVSCVLAISNGIDLLNILTEKYNTYFSSMVVTGCIVSFYVFFFHMSLGKTKFISRKSFVFLGAFTYPLYLIHQNIGYIFFYHFADEDNKYLILSIMIMLALLISYIINTYIEKRYGRKFKIALEKYASFFIRKTNLAQKL